MTMNITVQSKNINKEKLYLFFFLIKYSFAFFLIARFFSPRLK